MVLESKCKWKVVNCFETVPIIKPPKLQNHFVKIFRVLDRLMKEISNVHRYPFKLHRFQTVSLL